MNDAPLAPELHPLGPDGLLVRFAATFRDDANAAVQALARALPETGIGLTECVPALASLYLRLAPDQDRAEAVRAVERLIASRDWGATAQPAPDRIWHIPVSFGPDDAPALPHAAQEAGVSEMQAIGAITGAALRVLAVGFAPGQPYIGLLPPEWDIPRRTDLTPKVPAGALVVALRQLVLFANASPTGWQQIGRTAFRPFRPESGDPMPLRAGDGIRFRRVAPDEVDTAEPRLEVLR